MPHKYFVFTNLADQSAARIGLASDTGWNALAIPGTDPKGRPGQVFDVPDSVQGEQGAQLNIDADGKTPQQLRGVLSYMGPDPTRAYLLCDDFVLIDLPTAPEPPPVTGNTPLEVINAVYATGQYNLATKTGCGMFTEECCRQLGALWGSPPWGHVAKAAGQNQYNAHAVDAVMSLYGSDHGIWDIITSSVSTSARPAFNRAGDSNPEIWRPPTPLPCQPAGTATREIPVTLTVTLADLIHLLCLLRVI